MIRISAKKTAVAAAVSVAFLAGALFQNSSEMAPVGSANAQAQTQNAAQLPDFTKLVEENGKTVVRIEVSKDAPRRKMKSQDFGFKGMPKDQLDQLRRFGFPFPFPSPDFGDEDEFQSPRGRGQGSGFIISSDGLILTNHHVVDGADKIKVYLTDGREFNGKIIGSDAKTDVAVIRIDAKDLPAAKIGESSKVKVGEWVAAIGAPFGLENTVTSGIVSAKSRDLPSDGFVPFIQTDAAVNPGNSGGPLFNMKGEVIGINSQIFSTSGGFMGLSFAIPIDLAIQVKDDLVEHGSVRRGRLGVVIQSLTPDLAKSLGVSKSQGALVAEVEKDSAADKGGIQEGDVVILFDDKAIEKAADLSRAVASAKPSTEHKVTVIRDGKETKLSVKVGKMAEDGKSEGVSDEPSGRLGVVVRSLNDEEKKKYTDGLAITEVSGAAEEAGLKAGDILLQVNGKKIRSFEQFKSAVDKAESSVALQFARDGKKSFIAVKLDSKKDKSESKKDKKDGK